MFVTFNFVTKIGRCLASKIRSENVPDVSILIVNVVSSANAIITMDDAMRESNIFYGVLF